MTGVTSQQPIDIRRNELVRKAKGLEAQIVKAKVRGDLRAAGLLEEKLMRTKNEIITVGKSKYPDQRK